MGGRICPQLRLIAESDLRITTWLEHLRLEEDEWGMCERQFLGGAMSLGD